MSKCPLQIYLNDRYLDSCTSVGPGNIFKNTFDKSSYKPEQLIYQKKFNKPGTTLENDKKNTVTTHNQNFPKCGSKSILSEYLSRHSKSIEAYHTLQKQQEEVLKLCKQKLAQRFPNAVLKDEDIVTALRIAQNSNYRLGCKSGDQITRAVLNVILSKADQTVNTPNSNRSKYSNSNNYDASRKNEKYRPELSLSEYFNSKKRQVVNKLVNLFTKPVAHRTYFTSSDNYFNNNQFVVNTSTMGLVRYPAITEDENCSTVEGRKRKVKNFMHKFGDTSHISGTHGDGGVSHSSFTPNAHKEYRKKKKNLFTYYCTYQRDVDILKVEIKKQKFEIRAIQKNLNLCLKILKSLEDKNSITKENFLKADTQNFHVFTPSCKGFHNPAEPYNRYYQQFKAEMQSCPASCSTDTATDTVSITSSNDSRKQNKCCTCNCFQKKPKKPKKPKKERQRKRSKSRRRSSKQQQIICKCPSSAYAVCSPPVSPSPEPEPPWEPPAECCCKAKHKGDFDRVIFESKVCTMDAAQETKESELQSTPLSDNIEDAISDTESVASTASTDSKKRRRKLNLKKLKKPPKKIKSKKKIKKSEEKPKKKSRCIRLLKILCCGSGCLI